jgi:hypothetical protein
LENDHFPQFDLTNRSNYAIPKEFIDPYNLSTSQAQMAVLLSESYKSLPKWIKEMILNELKPLFLRVRRLDESKKNCVLQNFFILLFPKFANNRHEKLIVISKELRKTYNNWRNVLWKKLVERHDKYKISESDNPNLYLKK